MTIETAIKAITSVAPRLSLRDRARVRAEQPITTPQIKPRAGCLVRSGSTPHSLPYADRFGPHVTTMRQWVDRVLSGPVGEMPCESERAAAAEWLMEPL